jgi:hypothetical protein
MESRRLGRIVLDDTDLPARFQHHELYIVERLLSVQPFSTQSACQVRFRNHMTLADRFINPAVIAPVACCIAGLPNR